MIDHLIMFTYLWKLMNAWIKSILLRRFGSVIGVKNPDLSDSLSQTLAVGVSKFNWNLEISLFSLSLYSILPHISHTHSLNAHSEQEELMHTCNLISWQRWGNLKTCFSLIADIFRQSDQNKLIFFSVTYKKGDCNTAVIKG